MSPEWTRRRQMICIIGDGEDLYGLGCAISPRHLISTARICGSAGAHRSATLPGGNFCGRTVWSDLESDLAIIEISIPIRTDTTDVADESKSRFPDLCFDTSLVGDQVGYAEPIAGELLRIESNQIAIFQEAWIHSVDAIGEVELVGAAHAHALPGAPVLQPDGSLLGLVTRARRSPLSPRVQNDVQPFGYFTPLRACASQLLGIVPAAIVEQWMARR